MSINSSKKKKASPTKVKSGGPKKKMKTGRRFSIIGTLGSTHASIKEMIVYAGGSVVAKLSKNVDVAIAGIAPGHKLELAKSLGIAIWTEDQLDIWYADIAHKKEGQAEKEEDDEDNEDDEEDNKNEDDEEGQSKKYKCDSCDEQKPASEMNLSKKNEVSTCHECNDDLAEYGKCEGCGEWFFKDSDCACGYDNDDCDDDEEDGVDDEDDGDDASTPGIWKKRVLSCVSQFRVQVGKEPGQCWPLRTGQQKEIQKWAQGHTYDKEWLAIEDGKPSHFVGQDGSESCIIFV